MNTVRLNITLPEDLSKQLEKIAGPRRKSRFIAHTLRQRIERAQHEQLQKLLEEGYRSGREEGLAITREFEPMDIEGWDDY